MVSREKDVEDLEARCSAMWVWGVYVSAGVVGDCRGSVNLDGSGEGLFLFFFFSFRCRVLLSSGWDYFVASIGI